MVETSLVDSIMKLHRCEDCPIRCRAMKRPHSVYARLHRWHRTWWPGWKIYLAELHSGEARSSVQA